MSLINYCFASPEWDKDVPDNLIHMEASSKSVKQKRRDENDKHKTLNSSNIDETTDKNSKKTKRKKITTSKSEDHNQNALKDTKLDSQKRVKKTVRQPNRKLAVSEPVLVIETTGNKTQIATGKSRKPLSTPDIAPKQKVTKAKKDIVAKSVKIQTEQEETGKYVKRLPSLNGNDTDNKLLTQEDKQVRKSSLNVQKLKELLKSNSTVDEIEEESTSAVVVKKGGLVQGGTLKERLMTKLKGARFRYINEQMYTSRGIDASKLFAEDPDAFLAYHEGYRHQVKQWPINPLDTIIKAIKKMGANLIIADFGCGDAKLQHSVMQKVHSFDLVSTVSGVTACDMANCPLFPDSIDVAVYCLSLMGTNLKEYIMEANRVLKIGGFMKIAEVASRFTKVESFIATVEKFGFKNSFKNTSNDMFYFLDFKKMTDIPLSAMRDLPEIKLNPCLYKKR